MTGVLCAKFIMYTERKKLSVKRTYNVQYEEEGRLWLQENLGIVEEWFMMLGNAVQLHAGLSDHVYQEVH